MQFRLWERIVLVGGAIGVLLYIFTNVVIYEFNQTVAINSLLLNQRQLEKVMPGPLKEAP